MNNRIPNEGLSCVLPTHSAVPLGLSGTGGGGWGDVVHLQKDHRCPTGVIEGGKAERGLHCWN